MDINPGDKLERLVTQLGHNILVVDDDKLIRDLTKDILNNYGYAVMTANDGVECVDIYSKMNKDISCVILDINMPNMSGREAFIRMKEFNPNVKVIVSTGHPEKYKVDMARLGASGFLKKPYEVDELVQKVRTILE